MPPLCSHLAVTQVTQVAKYFTVTLQLPYRLLQRTVQAQPHISRLCNWLPCIAGQPVGSVHAAAELLPYLHGWPGALDHHGHVSCMPMPHSHAHGSCLRGSTHLPGTHQQPTGLYAANGGCHLQQINKHETENHSMLSKYHMRACHVVPAALCL